MLGNSRVHPILLSKDLDQTREFYHDRLGLDILSESDHKIEFRCGSGTKLAVSKSTIGTADSQTQIGWEADDLQTEIDDIRARGVPIEEYDTPGIDDPQRHRRRGIRLDGLDHRPWQERSRDPPAQGVMIRPL